MEIKTEIKDLQKQKIMVATPMYGGQCAGIFAKSTVDLALLTSKYGIELRYYYLFNESLITRARNYCVDEFLRSDCTHLMFIDSDIAFSANDVLALLALSIHNEGDNEYDIICGPYPKKTISWEKIVDAYEKGYGRDNPFQLEHFVGDYVFNPVNTGSFPVNEPVEVSESGTGFMLIRRNTFEVYKRNYPELSYKPDHARSEHFDGSREIMAYFDCDIDPKSRRYLSEDYFFCRNARKAGLKVWLCPWMELKHVGSYIYGGSLSALAAIGASPTASEKSKKHSYTSKKKD